MLKMNSIYLMNCMEGMKQFPDKYFELAIVDPPYRDMNTPDQWLRANKGNMKKWKPAPKQNYFDELFRISKKQIIWGGNYFTNFLDANNNWIIWYKLNVNEGVHFSMCEMAWSSIRKNIQLKTLLPEKNKIHPTQKPVALYKWQLKKYAKEGDKILDTHMGSGSLEVACIEYGFDYIGFEIDKESFDDAKIRIEEAKIRIKNRLPKFIKDTEEERGIKKLSKLKF